jgi:hypothetical protein
MVMTLKYLKGMKRILYPAIQRMRLFLAGRGEPTLAVYIIYLNSYNLQENIRTKKDIEHNANQRNLWMKDMGRIFRK